MSCFQCWDCSGENIYYKQENFSSVVRRVSRDKLLFYFHFCSPLPDNWLIQYMGRVVRMITDKTIKQLNDSSRIKNQASDSDKDKPEKALKGRQYAIIVTCEDLGLPPLLNYDLRMVVRRTVLPDAGRITLQLTDSRGRGERKSDDGAGPSNTTKRSKTGKTAAEKLEVIKKHIGGRQDGCEIPREKFNALAEQMEEVRSAITTSQLGAPPGTVSYSRCKCHYSNCPQIHKGIPTATWVVGALYGFGELKVLCKPWDLTPTNEGVSFPKEVNKVLVYSSWAHAYSNVETASVILISHRWVDGETSDLPADLFPGYTYGWACQMGAANGYEISKRIGPKEAHVGIFGEGAVALKNFPQGNPSDIIAWDERKQKDGQVHLAAVGPFWWLPRASNDSGNTQKMTKYAQERNHEPCGPYRMCATADEQAVEAAAMETDEPMK